MINIAGKKPAFREEKKTYEKMFNDPYETIFWSALWNKLFKHSLFEDVLFPNVVVYEDLFILPEIFEKCERIACISNKLYNYVQHCRSVLHTTDIKNIEGAFVYFHLACFFSGKKEYVNIYLQMLFSGISNYRLASLDKSIKKNKNSHYKTREKEAVMLFRSSWKRGRGLVKHSVKRFLFFELFFVNMDLGLAFCNYMKKTGRL